MHQKFGKHRTCSSGDVLAERQTETHRHTNHNTCAPLTGVCKVMNASFALGNHKGHSKPFNTNFLTLVYLQMHHYRRLSCPL